MLQFFSGLLSGSVAGQTTPRGRQIRRRTPVLTAAGTGFVKASRRGFLQSRAVPDITMPKRRRPSRLPALLGPPQ
jgi:hypothetical protein